MEIKIKTILDNMSANLDLLGVCIKHFYITVVFSYPEIINTQQ